MQVETFEKLNKEIDFLEFIRLKRLTEFNNSFNVPDHQAYFVTKFRKFCITDEPEDATDRFEKMVEEASQQSDKVKDELEHSFNIGYTPEDYKKDMVEKMARRMNLKDNTIDKKILREILPPALLEHHDEY